MTVAPEENLEPLAELFHLMGDPNRLRILVRILRAPAAVGRIATDVGLSQSLVSHNLRLLRAGRLVRARRRGRRVYYEPADHHVRSVLSDMIEHLSEPGGAVGAGVGTGLGAGLGAGVEPRPEPD